MLLRDTMRRKIVANDILIEEVANAISRGEKAVILTKGTSMLPFIVGGRDSVELSPCNATLSRGEILLAKISHPTRYVIHRVVAIEGDEVVLMGDGNVNCTERCHRDDVIARVTMIIEPNGMVDPYSKKSLRRARIWGCMLPLRRYILYIRRKLYPSI